MRGRVVQIVFARDVNSACADVFVGVCDWCVCGRVGCVCGCECVNCFMRVCVDRIVYVRMCQCRVFGLCIFTCICVVYYITCLFNMLLYYTWYYFTFVN